MASPSFAHDRFYIQQLVRPVVNLYQVSALADGDVPGDPVAYARQKRMALREDIRFFVDESESEELFRIKARQVLNITGRNDVLDAAGRRIGVLEKVFGRSLLRSTWRILDADEQELAVARERSVPVAVARRLVDFVPYVGDFIPIPYHFNIVREDAQIGELTRKLAVRDRYVLDLSGDPERILDRRVAIALAIALDALQDR